MRQRKVFHARRACGWMVAALATLTLLTSGCATTGGRSQNAVIHAKNIVAPALVHIRPVKEVYAQGQRKEVLIVGSGFIISPDGYVVTNEHVAGESKVVRCVLGDKNEVDAKVVGVDPYTDLAVLKLDVPEKLPFVRLGDSSKLEAGQTVMAMGSPHGLSRSVSMGIVSVTDRNLGGQTEGGISFSNWIQTDAAINPGNSGGPLVDLRGDVIGVNTMVLRGAENVGFAIPSNMVRQVVDSIIAKGRVERSWVGLDLQEMLARTDDATRQGVVVADIDPLSPAAEARTQPILGPVRDESAATPTGIQPGDILVAVNGTPVNARFEEDLPKVHKLIADLPVGQPATFTFQRGDQKIDIPIVTEEQGGLKGAQVEYTEWGFTASELTPAIVRRARLESRQGVLVSGTQVGGLANKVGLTQGDIILSVDDVVVENLEQFSTLYRERVDKQVPLVLLSVRNRALHRFVLVKQDPAMKEVATAPAAPAVPAEGVQNVE
ncbi:MAG: trypsin-like peptidase domain-containing protein [Candidatus Hydrogenedentes bacterium]|nr:trypsin-like peptidase domain-containing protein [Candidatus Hydrogenedentota bacterium]